MYDLPDQASAVAIQGAEVEEEAVLVDEDIALSLNTGSTYKVPCMPSARLTSLRENNAITREVESSSHKGLTSANP